LDSEEVPEQEASSEVEPQPAVEQEEAQVEIPQISYASLGEVDLESLDASTRAHVEPILSLAIGEADSHRRSVEAYDHARDELLSLSQELGDMRGEDLTPFVARIESQTETIESLITEATDTAFTAFLSIHPEVIDLPDDITTEVAHQFEGLGSKFKGNSLLEQMEQAYQFALFSKGYTNKQAEPASTVSAKPKANPRARRQAAVADGSVGLSKPKVGVDELTWDELMGRNLHLL